MTKTSRCTPCHMLPTIGMCAAQYAASVTGLQDIPEQNGVSLTAWQVIQWSSHRCSKYSSVTSKWRPETLFSWYADYWNIHASIWKWISPQSCRQVHALSLNYVKTFMGWPLVRLFGWSAHSSWSFVHILQKMQHNHKKVAISIALQAGDPQWQLHCMTNDHHFDLFYHATTAKKHSRKKFQAHS